MNNQKIRIAICGFGNLGKGVAKAISKTNDMELVVIFTRRNPEEISKQAQTTVVSINEMKQWEDKIDVVIMCGGSATDIPKQVPEFAQVFNTIDSFDTHADIPEYYKKIDKIARDNNHLSIISLGWDPGMFSLNRVLADSILPNVNTYTFWGKGVSQGHSDAIRRIPGVKNAVQYTIPIEKAVNIVRNGENPILSPREKHLRECYVVAEDGADYSVIENSIKTMPKYFDEYDTIVHFITEEELKRNHSGMPHGGNVISIGETGSGNKQVIEYSLKLDSNPEFTGAVLVAYARANYRMHSQGITGAKTILDIAPCYMSPKTTDELLKMI